MLLTDTIVCAPLHGQAEGCHPLQDFNRVWKGLEPWDCQRMSLVWETQELLALNSSIVTFLKDQARPS